MKTTNPCIKIGLLLLAAAMFTAGPAHAVTYSWTNFQSDIAGVAQHTDSNLVNPWGMAVSSGGTIWVSDNGTGVSTLYRQDGTAMSLVVHNSHGFPEQRNRQSHRCCLQQHIILRSHKRCNLGARSVHFCQ